jgi:ABC-type glycerol-3-phosphate transport system substrate-binding protein
MTARALGLTTLALAVLGGLVTFSEKVVRRKPVQDRVTVVYWEKWTGDEGARMRDIVHLYNASQDRVFVKMLTISGVADKTLLAASGGNPPDVAGLWNVQIAQFADAKALTDLTALAAEKGIQESDYIPAYWDMGRYRGGLYALPSTPASTALHINTDQVPPGTKLPRTLEELSAFADLTAERDTDGRLKHVGFLPAEPGWWNYYWGVWFGGQLFDGENLTINSPENVRAFEWVESFARRFGVREVQNFQSGFGNFSSPQNAFLNQKVGSVLQGVWMANYVRLYNPTMHWTAIPFPVAANRPDLQGRSIVEMDTLVIPRGARYPREAFDFIAFVQRQDVMEKLCTSHGKNSPLVKVSEAFLANHPNKEIRLFDRLARSKNAIHPPLIGIWPQITNEMTNAFQLINLGQKTPRQALDEAQARLDPAWRRYRRQVLGEGTAR